MKAPFPWFGGKRRVAHFVWEHFGNIRNYVEPFAGSLAVLLARPTEPKIETVNDLDCLIANFWRAIQCSPADVAFYADWPVNEADLHARHLWLVKRVHTKEWRERMMTDADFYDAKVAGFWVWGISQWIGSGWCAAPGTKVRMSDGFVRSMQRGDGTPQRGRPCLQQGQGIEGLITPGRGAAGKSFARGVQAVANRQSPPGDPWQKRPRLDRGGRGVLATKRQVPDISGEAGAAGRGVHASGLPQKIPNIAGREWGLRNPGLVEESGVYEWFNELAARLRRVRVCCGQWDRILGPAPTTCIGVTGVFLDPPYAVEDRSDVYGEESRDVAHQVREWAIANGDNPDLRIALCGYEGEHSMPASWSVVRWKAGGGYGNQGQSVGSRGSINAQRERIWFSPHCIAQQQPALFDRFDAGEAVFPCATAKP